MALNLSGPSLDWDYFRFTTNTNFITQSKHSLTRFQLLHKMYEHLRRPAIYRKLFGKLELQIYVKNTNLNLKTSFICHATYCRSKTEYLPSNEFYSEKSFVTNWIKKIQDLLFTCDQKKKKRKNFYVQKKICKTEPHCLKSQ